MKKKTIALILSCVLVLGCAIGGTFAWLTATSGPVTNTFTVGDINITLDESEYVQSTNTLNENVRIGANEQNIYKMIPGRILPKDPTVTVKAGSEDCWLFVKVAKSNVLDSYIDYSVNPTDNDSDADTSKWVAGTGANGNGIPNGVYFRKVTASNKDQSFSVIGYTNDENNFVKNKVLVKTDVTKQMMNNLEAAQAEQPTLTFTACAVQLENLDTVQKAWAAAPASFTGATSGN